MNNKNNFSEQNLPEQSSIKIDFLKDKNNFTSDSIVNSIIHKFINRSDLGIQKYGTTLDRNDLSTNDWIQHVQEELMDAILYLEKLKGLNTFKKSHDDSFLP